MLLFLVWPRLMFAIDPDAPPVSREHLEHSIASESLARERVARGAEGMIATEGALNGSDWAWGAGQLIAGASAGEPGHRAAAISIIWRRSQNPGCHCFHSDGIPHAIGNGWVVMAAARFGRPPPGRTA